MLRSQLTWVVTTALHLAALSYKQEIAVQRKSGSQLIFLTTILIISSTHLSTATISLDTWFFFPSFTSLYCFIMMVPWPWLGSPPVAWPVSLWCYKNRLVCSNIANIWQISFSSINILKKMLNVINTQMYILTWIFMFFCMICSSKYSPSVGKNWQHSRNIINFQQEKWQSK